MDRFNGCNFNDLEYRPLGERLSALHKYSKLLYIPFLIPLCADKKWRDRILVAFLVGVSITVLFSYLKVWGGLRFGSNPDQSAVFTVILKPVF